MKSRILPILFLFCLAAPLSAQEEQPSWLVRTGRTFLNRVTARKASLDSVYVLQPGLKWTTTLESELIFTGADLHSDITLTDLTGDNPEIVHGTMDTGMQGRPYRKVGVAGGYGSLTAGFGVDLGKKKGERNKYFTLGMTSVSQGIQVHYYKTHQYPRGNLDLPGWATMDLSSDYPGELRTLSAEAFYAFNRHRFVYSAAYKGRILQRRSAGSWMMTMKYLQGDFSLNREDDLWEMLNDLQRYSTWQFSVGGGYSFNWVILHRDPSGPGVSGLRNLTVNATVLPMISFLNYVQTEQETETGNGTVKVRYNGQPAFSPTLRGAVCYSFGRCSICAEAGYSRFGFQGIDTEISEENDYLRTKVRTQGVFYDLTVEGKVNVRF